VEIPDDFSKLLTTILEFDPSMTTIMDRPEIYKWFLSSREICSIHDALVLLESAAFHGVPYKYFAEINAYFWANLDGYDGVPLEISAIATNCLEVDGKFDQIFMNVSKFTSFPIRVYLDVYQAKRLTGNVPFDVVELTMYNFDFELVNKFANTLERLIVRTDCPFTKKLALLPRLKFLYIWILLYGT
jgi:hypothetical protein